MVDTEPQLGDIACTQINGDDGRLIALGEWLNGDRFSEFQHAFVYIGNNEIVEAEPGGARIGNLAEYDSRTTVWVRCPEQYREAVAAAAKELLGVGYSALDYFALAAHRLHLPIPGLNRLVLGEKRMICSQLSVTAARRGGWDLLAPEPAGYVTPAELAKLAEPVS